MIMELLQLFLTSMLISVAAFGGGSPALFYQFGVTQHNWINPTDLSAMLAFGYSAPGPTVFGTATFIGYHVAGFWGAAVATVGVFAVPFVGAILAAKYLTGLLHNRYAAFVLAGVGLAATGVVSATALHMLSFHQVFAWQIGVMILAFIASLVLRVHPLFIMFTGLVIGLLI
jgi:chromate transporter